MKKEEEKKSDENICSKADIVGETYEYILDENSQDDVDIEVEQNNELLNPDPHSMDSRG